MGLRGNLPKNEKKVVFSPKNFVDDWNINAITVK